MMMMMKRTGRDHSNERVSISQTLFQNPYHAPTSRDDIPMAQVKDHAQVTRLHCFGDSRAYAFG